MHNPQFDRIHILLQQKKFTEAERIVKDMLIQDPHDVYLLSLMSELCLQQDKIDQAASLIDTAIGLSPDSPDLFLLKPGYCCSRINMMRLKISCSRP